MGQTLGSQIFGSWYEVIVPGFIAAIFFYYAIASENMPLEDKKKLPAFMLNKNICILLGSLLALLSIGKALKWW